jgi:predicted outer membrane repeat protein
MFNNSSSPTVKSVTFSHNFGGQAAGGMGNWYSSSPTLTNVTFSSNSATSYGGGMNNTYGTPTLTNVTFSNNSAQYGGAMVNYSNSPTIRNTIFWGNTATSDGAQIYNMSGSTPNVSYSVVQGGFAGGTNIITTDPLLGTLGDYGGFTQTIPLLAGSSAINAGNSTYCTTGSDQRGVSYVSTCDIGAFEYAGIDYISVRYTKPTASGSGDCSSWANACTLQTALTGAAYGQEIWSEAGTYKPTTVGTTRSATFQLKNGVALYGGFAGTETARTQRDPAANLTILSGDIDNNDTQMPIITNLTTVSGNTTNSIHVVTGATGATLDGFSITAGYADGGGCPGTGCGAGMYNSNSSNPTLTNITFSGNLAGWGGGMANDSSSPTLTNITFSGNSTSQAGGGMYNNASSSLILTNVTFSNNSSSLYAGGMFNYDSSAILTNVTFTNNSATSYGGGMANRNSSPALTNVTFSGNSSGGTGGGIWGVTNSNPTIRNTIFGGNTATAGAQIYDWDGSSSPIVSDSVVQDGYVGGTNIIITDPKLGTLGNYGGSTQTIPLLAGSSAIDTGNNATCAATDQRGVVRPQGAHCDIGAYEV